MPTRSLPNNPSLEHLRKEAKRLHKAVRDRNADALARVKEFHPPPTGAGAHWTLADAQLVTARSYGFASWTNLKEYLAAIEPFVWSTPPRPDSGTSFADMFVRLACLVYGDWQRTNVAKARRLLADHPEIASDNVYAAAATGDVANVRAMLDSDPALVNANGGPLHWDPLLYACYSRMDDGAVGRSTVEIARLLLERGADPNAGFLWNGSYAFTALTGAFARSHDRRERLGLLHRAIAANERDGVRLIVELGVDVNGMIPNTGLDRAPLHSAAGGGDLEMVKLLIDLGADPQLRDYPFHAAPIGWAKYGQHQDVVDYLFRYASIFDAVHLGGVERAMSLLEQSPSLAQARDDDGDPLAFYLYPDMDRLDEMIALLTRHGVDLSATGRGGARLLERALAHGWTEFADLLRRHGARTS